MFQPDPFGGHNIDELIVWVETQFQKLANLHTELEVDFIKFVVHHTEPTRPIEGYLYYADGSDWNPGYGRGLYVYTTGWEPVVNILTEERINPAKLTLTTYPPSYSNG